MFRSLITVKECKETTAIPYKGNKMPQHTAILKSRSAVGLEIFTNNLSQLIELATFWT